MWCCLLEEKQKEKNGIASSGSDAKRITNELDGMERNQKKMNKTKCFEIVIVGIDCVHIVRSHWTTKRRCCRELHKTWRARERSAHYHDNALCVWDARNMSGNCTHTQRYRELLFDTNTIHFDKPQRAANEFKCHLIGNQINQRGNRTFFISFFFSRKISWKAIGDSFSADIPFAKVNGEWSRFEYITIYREANTVNSVFCIASHSSHFSIQSAARWIDGFMWNTFLFCCFLWYRVFGTVIDFKCIHAPLTIQHLLTCVCCAVLCCVVTRD